MFFQTHNTRSIGVGLALGWTVLVGALTFAVDGLAQVTERVSVDSDGVQADQNSAFQSSISADGRYVAFESGASNLVPGDANGWSDVFVHDRQTGATERVSVAGDGTEGNQASGMPSISADGRYVAFQSTASNLVPDDTNGAEDIFVRDRLTGAIERVNVDNAGHQTVTVLSYSPSISGDGRYVAFVSGDDYLVADDNNRRADIFVRDRQTGVTQRVSVSSSGAQADLGSDRPRISSDGRYVAFLSAATNLVSGDSNGKQDAFVHDRQTGRTERVSVATTGAQGYDQSEFVSISSDGRYTAFLYWGDDLVPNDTNGASDVFVRDRVNALTQRVSVSSNGVQGRAFLYDPLSSYDPQISSNGRYVAFSSWADNLVPGDANGTTDVFVHDRLLGRTEMVSVSTAGDQADMQSLGPAVNGDGRFVAFGSLARNLVSDDTNGVIDVFVRDRGPADRLVNISTRGAVVSAPGGLLNAGFIISPTGSGSKQVLIRARGPSMGGAPFNLPGTLANPTMRLVSAGTTIAQNDDWATMDPLCLSPATWCGDAEQITTTGKSPCTPNPGQTAAPPGCTQEAALLVTLPPGPYSVVVSGVGGTTGIALVEVFEVDTSSLLKLVNISTRGTVVSTPGGLLNGGFIIGPSASGGKQVLIRARGPSMGGAPFNLPGTLANPTMRLVSAGTIIAQNSDWATTDALCLSPATWCGDAAQIMATGKSPCMPNPGQTAAPPGCTQEAALLVTLPPGPYSVVVSGVGGTTGIALVEVFEVP